MNWYALFVESGKEETVRKLLSINFDSTILYSIIPKRMIPERKKGIVENKLRKLFPGYVFIKTKMDHEMYHEIKKTPRLLKILRTKDTFYQIIPNNEMNPILNLTANKEVIDFSKVYVSGSSVEVISGPLKGLEGLIVSINKRKKRAKIRLQLLDKEMVIEVGIDVLQ